MSTRPKSIVNLADVSFAHHTHGDRYEASDAEIGPVVGAVQLGYSLTVLPPGKRAYPMHNHHINEEMFLVLEGEGQVRIGKEAYALKKGDLVACPAGGPETAHQIVNTGTTELRFLAVSTMHASEVVEYPESGKVMVRGGASFRFRGKLGPALAYWDEE